jgi:uncharacterized protein YdhG (YjbR/CyaY superfamily)
VRSICFLRVDRSDLAAVRRGKSAAAKLVRSDSFRLDKRSSMPAITSPTTIDEYIAGYPPEVQAILKKVRSTIKAAAPDAVEAIKYQIPTFVLNGNLVSFAAYKQHIGLYPVPAGTQKFQKAVAVYQTAKSTLRFPLDEPIPYDLISRLVKYLIKEHAARARAAQKK